MVKISIPIALVLIVFTANIKPALNHEGFMDIRIISGKFVSLKLETAKLFGPLPSDQPKENEANFKRNNEFALINNNNDVFKVLNSAPSSNNNNGSSRFEFMVMLADEAELPTNWNFLVTDDQKFIIFYGYPTLATDYTGTKDKGLEKGRPKHDDQNHIVLDIEIIRYDYSGSLGYKKALIKLTIEKREGFEKDLHKLNFTTESLGVERKEVKASISPAPTISKEYAELEFAFHHIRLIEFLDKSYPAKLEDLFSQVIWLHSRLIRVEDFPSTKGVLIKLRNPSNQLAPQFERLLKEIKLATREEGGERNESFPGSSRPTAKRLCEYKKSKTISIEYMFRSLDLYPNWCTLKFTKIAKHDSSY